MFVYFLWRGMVGEGRSLVRSVPVCFIFVVKFGFPFWERVVGPAGLEFQPRLPSPPPPPRGRRQDVASWCLELTQVQRLWGVGNQE